MCARVFDFMGDDKDMYRYWITLPVGEYPRAHKLFAEARHLIKGGEDYILKDDPTHWKWYLCRCCFHKPLDDKRNPDQAEPTPERL